MNELINVTINENHEPVITIDVNGEDARYEKIFIEVIGKEFCITFAASSGTNQIFKVPLWEE